MYRQVVLDNPEKDFHRILWRESKDGPLRHLRMKRVTYGIASSAFHSTRCLKEIANRTENSIVRDCLNRCFYVDDFLGGAPTIDEAKSLLDNLVKKLRRYGFDLRKWASSHTELISELPVEMRENADSLELFSDEYRIKALGISWHPNTDMFFFKVDLEEITEPTKRALLSDSSKIFDPMGWVSPVIILFKSLVQRTWVQDLSWDDKLPDDLVEQWYRIRKELEYLNPIKIPRCVRPPKTTALELHVFCDASEMAYASVVYIRARGPTGFSCKLLTSKTKVAPVKALPMPRLELCAATLGANLTNSLRQTLEVSLVTAWTDPTIVLNWLSKLPRTWNTFVANRVATVQEEIPRNQWKYVPSKDNPADMASRGLLASEILKMRFGGMDRSGCQLMTLNGLWRPRLKRHF